MSIMLDEIRQQPDVLDRTLREQIPAVESLKRAIVQRQPRMVILAARGTSDNAALFGRYLLEISTGVPVSMAAPSTFTLYGAKINYRDALVVGISQSGESTDTNIVIERARDQGALTVGITNEAQSSLAGLAEVVFHVKAGQERSVAATKTYTGQLMMIYLLAYAMGAPISIDQLRQIPAWADAALKLENDIGIRASRYRFMERTVVVGRGLNYANAFEFALKLMETCYIVAERFSSADFLHGPIAMVESSFPVFLFTPGGVTWSSMQTILDKVGVARAEMLLITDRSNPEAVNLGLRTVCIPARLAQEGPLPEEVFTPIPYIIPAQLFAAALAEEKGLDPDQPRGLSKVTRTL
ncbi:MAG: SIS domain-containing protein [Bryobacteraceae bacterium]